MLFGFTGYGRCYRHTEKNRCFKTVKGEPGYSPGFLFIPLLNIILIIRNKINGIFSSFSGLNTIINYGSPVYNAAGDAADIDTSDKTATPKT